MIALAVDDVRDVIPPGDRTNTGGPRTAEGKDRARRNALKHGLRARACLPEDMAQRVEDLTVELGEALRPESPFEAWLVGQAALASARLERCAEMAVADLLRAVARAELAWDQDRRAEAEDLGARLAAEPARTARALRSNRHGADWLLGRWRGLAAVARACGGWDGSQRSLALDLLGTPAELRAAPGLLPEGGDDQAAFAEAQAERLLAERSAGLDELDESLRAQALAGLPAHEDATSARLRRYESEARRDLRWALSELRRSQASRPAPAVELAPEPAPPVVAAPAVEPGPEPAAAVEPEPTMPAAPAPAAASGRPRNRRLRRALEKMASQTLRKGG